MVSAAVRPLSSGGTSSDGRRNNHSLSVRNGSRLVARMAICGAFLRTGSAVVAAALMTCSQLSRTINARLSRSHATRLLSGSPTPGVLPMAALIELATKAGSWSDDRPTNQTPSV